ncbi:hypothetical protein BDV34DRAFT_38141 [Aspergillus parasiticus]|uniref:Uncharacterized protein n=1 Tax=Aspergillus parasiticus TaxID=5067 RepID=A0A5N6DUT2_ASPPA|nr:hypothetical protein BDV34DRAFT_38141 [Aspergillus parasiticus]
MLLAGHNSAARRAVRFLIGFIVISDAPSNRAVKLDTSENSVVNPLPKKSIKLIIVDSLLSFFLTLLSNQVLISPTALATTEESLFFMCVSGTKLLC